MRNSRSYFAVVDTQGIEHVSAARKRDLADCLTDPGVLWNAGPDLPLRIVRIDPAACVCEDWAEWNEDEIVSLGGVCPFCGSRIEL